MNYTIKEATEINFRVNYRTNHGNLKVSETIMGNVLKLTYSLYSYRV